MYHIQTSNFFKLLLCPTLLSTLSAIIEHTNKVLYLEDNDIAVVTGGKLSIHRLKRQAGDDPVRAIQTLQMEMQQIMKGQRVKVTFWYMSYVDFQQYLYVHTYSVLAQIKSSAIYLKNQHNAHQHCFSPV